MKCPKCGSALDTGFNCPKCGYKRYAQADIQPELTTVEKLLWLWDRYSVELSTEKSWGISNGECFDKIAYCIYLDKTTKIVDSSKEEAISNAYELANKEEI